MRVGRVRTPNAGRLVVVGGCPVSFFRPACAILQLFRIRDRAILFVSDGPALLHSSPGRPLVRRISPAFNRWFALRSHSSRYRHLVGEPVAEAKEAPGQCLPSPLFLEAWHVPPSSFPCPYVSCGSDQLAVARSACLRRAQGGIVLAGRRRSCGHEGRRPHRHEGHQDREFRGRSPRRLEKHQPRPRHGPVPALRPGPREDRRHRRHERQPGLHRRQAARRRRLRLALRQGADRRHHAVHADARLRRGLRTPRPGRAGQAEPRRPAAGRSQSRDATSTPSPSRKISTSRRPTTARRPVAGAAADAAGRHRASADSLALLRDALERMRPGARCRAAARRRQHSRRGTEHAARAGRRRCPSP